MLKGIHVLKRIQVRLYEWQYELLKEQRKRGVTNASHMRQTLVVDKIDLGRKLVEYGQLYRRYNGKRQGRINYESLADAFLAKQAFPDSPNHHARRQLVERYVAVAEGVTEQEEAEYRAGNLKFERLVERYFLRT